jgi:hypothetical protein
LGANVLSRLLIRQESQDLLKGIKIAHNGAPISHYLWMILFFSQKLLLRRQLISILVWIYIVVGLGKLSTVSSIHFSKNTTPFTINSISGTFPFKQASISSKLLGLPFFFGKAKLHLLRIFWKKS